MSVQRKNQMISERLRLIGNLVNLEGGPNVAFKSKAYFKAAEVISALDIPADHVSDFKNYIGIGESTSQAIEEILATGTSTRLETLRKKHPKAEDALKLTVVPGVGVKKAMALYQQGITTLQELADACDSGKISNEQIIRGVKLALQSRGRLPINEVLPVVNPILARLRESSEVVSAQFAGSVRRGSETVKDVDLIVVSTDPSKTSNLFLSMGNVLISGQEKARITVPVDANTAVQVDLLFTKPESLGSALAYFTGSKEHNIALRKRANDLGHTLNEHGFFTLAGQRWGGASEQELYQKLGLPWCPPELREGGELLTEIPTLITREDIDCDFHAHTTYSSDAISTVMEMAMMAQKRGLKSLGLTDHVEPNYGWTTEGITTRYREIKEAEQATGIKIYASAEIGVDPDGKLIDRIDLERQEYLIASIHRQHFNDPVGRLIEAMKHPRVKIIGHPTGRSIGRRDIPEADWDQLFQVASQRGVALEINGARLDLPVELIRRAKSFGCKFVLNSDAHSTEQFVWQDYSIMLARRAGLTKADLLKPSITPIK